ncbi:MULTISPECIES: hypothetical protein [Streptomyces]|uniref:Uncharacterized protein n=2 Tax=Streptomyces TaxID=1883 RepID=A0A1D8G787_9ACTN|nr:MULTISPECIES: hypothetical protein [Streptomyces]AOT61322.1 hypothetical protein A4G23_04205 [Streptomyces rubrolavendulae]OSY51919.1 hypothetical protein BG846_02467 [Streptomyces fradiae ATCC 10745 = DSM 40063]
MERSTAAWTIAAVTAGVVLVASPAPAPALSPESAPTVVRHGNIWDFVPLREG